MAATRRPRASATDRHLGARCDRTTVRRPERRRTSARLGERSAGGHAARRGAHRGHCAHARVRRTTAARCGDGTDRASDRADHEDGIWHRKPERHRVRRCPHTHPQPRRGTRPVGAHPSSRGNDDGNDEPTASAAGARRGPDRRAVRTANRSGAWSRLLLAQHARLDDAARRDRRHGRRHPLRRDLQRLRDPDVAQHGRGDRAVQRTRRDHGRDDRRQRARVADLCRNRWLDHIGVLGLRRPRVSLRDLDGNLVLDSHRIRNVDAVRATRRRLSRLRLLPRGIQPQRRRSLHRAPHWRSHGA